MRSNRTYGSELVMPMNEMAFDSDEMEYVDGGGVPAWLVGAGIDIALTAATGGAGLSFSAVGYLFGRGATFVVQKVAKYAGVWIAERLAQFLGILGSSYGCSKLGALETVLGVTSVGSMVSTMCDVLDGSYNGFINLK